MKQILTKPRNRQRNASCGGVPKDVKMLPVAKADGINQHCSL
jgi:hypothetical protein